MPQYSAGEARLSVVPDSSDFKRRLEADLRRITASFAVDVTADTTGATVELDRWITAQSGRDVNVRVDVDTAPAMAKIAAMRTALAAGGGGGGVLPALGWNAGALAIGSLPAMATAITNVAGAVQQLVGAGFALPGMLAGMGASLGTAALGFSGMGEAITAAVEAADGTPESLQKAADAMKDLPGPAREVVTAISGIKPQFDDLKASVVQTNMFDGLATSITALADVSMPTLRRGLGGMATAWNGTLKQLTASLGSEQSQGLLDRILGNTGEAQTRFNAAIDPLVQGLGTLFAGSTDALPRLADGITAVTERFNNFITAADKDGRLDKWINEGLDGFTDLGNTLLNLGKSFTAITQAAGGGAGLLGTLEQSTAKLQEFLNSTEGQDMLTRFFAEGREQLDKWLPILRNVGDMLGSVYQASKQWTDALLPPLKSITGFLAEHPGLIEGVATAFLAWKTLDGVTSLVSSLTGITTLLRVGLPTAAAAGAASMGSALGPIVAMLAGIPAAFALTHPDVRNPIPQVPTQLPGESAESYNQRIIDAGLPGLSQLPPKPDSSGLAGILGAPAPAPAPDPRATQGPVTVAPAPGGFAPGAQVQGITTPSGAVVEPEDLGGLLAGYDKGGPTPSGRGNGPTGGWISELHGDEWVLPAHARRAVGDKTLWALTSGRSFEPGGYVDQYGNPVTPGGPMPGPAPGSVAPVAPNPTSGMGGLGGIFGQFMSGLQGPIGNAMSLASALPGVVQGMPGTGGAGAAGGGLAGIAGLQSQHGVGTLGATPTAGLASPTVSSLFGIGGATQDGTALGNMATRAAGIPGFGGLFGSLASPDPVGNLMQWGSNSAQYVANWGMDTLGRVGSTLWQGALGFFGLENSILSPSNIYNQAVASTGQYFLDAGGPLGTLFGAGSTGGQNSLLSGMGGLENLTDEQKQQLLGQGGLPAGLKLPKGVGSEKGLQVNTIKVKRAVSAMFPAITEIGGWREDALKWHPNGLAIDVMVPGWDTPAGKAYGDQIYSYVAANADALGVDMDATLWQTKDHYNHIHIATTGGGYPTKGTEFMMPGAAGVPTMATGGPTPSTMGPVDAQGGHLAVVHPKEFMISARGRATVPDSFLHALNQGMVDPKTLPGFAGGGPVPAGLVTPTPRPNIAPSRPTQTKTAPPAAAAVRPPAAPGQATPAAPVPMPAPATPTPPPSIAPTPPTPADPAAPIGAPTTGISSVAPAPGSLDHNLKAIDTLISSGSSALGQAVSTAIGLGAGAGGGMVPGLGALGAIGPYAAGAIQQGGKVLTDLVNVGSSFLVGSVPGSYGDPKMPAYGQTLRAPQNAPITSQPRQTNNTFNGISDINRLMDRLDLRESVAEQSILAKYN
ncbi:hypothetical protein [Arthrobacter sp. SLBN-53]|uniref:hypothetical protein n=1 Tax=Arthrobacter sp. SLBN-53 TaxID=2768412 RepID=UPI00114F0766|nr:hypothetical protein [Arthrobacter sp. SLBN-53]TQK29375.1 hypothetical protein FBY28_2378 [Arthrobacter sp. SLBN-53]